MISNKDDDGLSADCQCTIIKYSTEDSLDDHNGDDNDDGDDDGDEDDDENLNEVL